MTNNGYFEATRFGTDEIIKIPLHEVLDVQYRSSEPGQEYDQGRVFMVGVDNGHGGKVPNPLNDEDGLVLIALEDTKTLLELSSE